MKGSTAFLISVILAGSFCMVCRANEAEYVALENALDSLSNVVVKYQSEFDKKVKFDVLGEAIKSIDEAMLTYEGTAKRHLEKIRQLNSDAHLTYTRCVGPVFEWCVAANSTFNVVIPHIASENTSDHDKNVIWNMTVHALSAGLTKTTDSMDLLEQVQSKVKALKLLLDDILNEMHEDFGPSGHYGKHKAELMRKISDIKAGRVALVVAGIIAAIFVGIVAIVTGGIGITLSLLPFFVGRGLDAIIQGREQASYERQLEVIEAFFELLEQRINEARKVAAEVDLALREDRKNLHALADVIYIADSNKNLLLMENPAYRGRLVPKLQDLATKCTDYVFWHGYGSEGYQKKQSRAKRQATAACEELRLKRLLARLPEIFVFNTMVAEAHAVMMEMSCEDLATFEQNPGPTPVKAEVENSSGRAPIVKIQPAGLFSFPVKHVV